MNRRSFGLAALCSGALLVGTFLGGQTSLPSVYAKAPPQTSSDALEPNGEQAPVKDLKKPNKVCKTTKECPKDSLCIKFGDHKECTEVPKPEPIVPVQT